MFNVYFTNFRQSVFSLYLLAFFVLLVQLDDFLKGLETLFVSRNVRRVCARLYLVMGKNAISIQSDCKYTRGI